LGARSYRAIGEAYRLMDGKPGSKRLHSVMERVSGETN
jgi:hypothetical protein